MQKGNSDTSNRELYIERLLNAPVDLVWEVWTDPKHIAEWWGPNGFTNSIYKMDIRAGGEWELTLHGPDGTDYPNSNVFIEVVKNKKIVFEHTNWPPHVTTVLFEDQGNKTLMKWHMLFESEEIFIQTVKKHGADEGLKQNVEKLGVYLLNQQKQNRAL